MKYTDFSGIQCILRYVRYVYSALCAGFGFAGFASPKLLGQADEGDETYYFD